jgi:L-ascorbate metabolism protein UlaG (beta-lactamase superfamily)
MTSRWRWSLTSWSARLAAGSLLAAAIGSAWWNDASVLALPEERFSARWMGATTILVYDGKSGILVDPYFSRLSSAHVEREPISPDTTRIYTALKRAGVSTLAVVLATRSNFDHAMDVPTVAARVNADVVGSRSTRNIARGLAFPEERIRTFEDGSFLAYGSFKLTAIESQRTPPSADPYAGEIAGPLTPPLNATAYRTGANYALLVEHGGRRVLIVSQPGFEPGKLIGVDADIVFLSVAGLTARGEHFASDYWRETALTTGAKLVILTDWDDPTRALDPSARPSSSQEAETAVTWIEELGAADGVEVRVPRAFDHIDLLTPLR